MDHLQGVQHVLEKWGEDKAICYIGLYHSIYGSELFVSISSSYLLSAVTDRVVLVQVQGLIQCLLRNVVQPPIHERASFAFLRWPLKGCVQVTFILVDHLAIDLASNVQQDFQLSMDKRHVVKDLIGDYAEGLVYIFCTMDLASLDATLNHAPGKINLAACKMFDTQSHGLMRIMSRK